MNLHSGILEEILVCFAASEAEQYAPLQCSHGICLAALRLRLACPFSQQHRPVLQVYGPPGSHKGATCYREVQFEATLPPALVQSPQRCKGIIE